MDELLLEQWLMLGATLEEIALLDVETFTTVAGNLVKHSRAPLPAGETVTVFAARLHAYAVRSMKALAEQPQREPEVIDAARFAEFLVVCGTPLGIVCVPPSWFREVVAMLVEQGQVVVPAGLTLEVYADGLYAYAQTVVELDSVE